jgi:hypothetical protein
LGRSRRELEDTMTSSEWAEVLALDSIQPFLGPERGDLRSGIIASLIANVNRDPDKSQPFSPLDFMPYSKMQQPEQSAEDQITVARMITEAQRLDEERRQYRG